MHRTELPEMHGFARDAEVHDVEMIQTEAESHVAARRGLRAWRDHATCATFEVSSGLNEVDRRVVVHDGPSSRRGSAARRDHYGRVGRMVFSKHGRLSSHYCLETLARPMLDLDRLDACLRMDARRVHGSCCPALLSARASLSSGNQGHTERETNRCDNSDGP
jgi:hypothetical protein